MDYSKIKIPRKIVTDLDGTLLRTNKTISQRTANTLLCCKNLGYQIIVATARPPRDIYKLLPECLKDNPIICYNGALVLHDRKVLYQHGLPQKTVLEIEKVAKINGYNKICLEIDNQLFANFDAWEDYGWVCKLVDFQNLSFDEALKVIVCSETPISEYFLNKLPQESSGVLTDKARLCQIMQTNVSKANSLNKIIGNREFIAFGDDNNDLEMLTATSFGVAMENATESLKKVATAITATNDEDGVALFLEENILKNGEIQQ
ncbi:HAD family hydrolase [Lactococcus kimchii]|uniref:HAD family hydrolase n=1 Tax=Lactococcus sp. S-13 TaxID=2507158 RepID=UPI001CC1EB20|nr:HAD family hydrolase [Lactococcus sp. S-13]